MLALGLAWWLLAGCSAGGSAPPGTGVGVQTGPIGGTVSGSDELPGGAELPGGDSAGGSGAAAGTMVTVPGLPGTAQPGSPAGSAGSGSPSLPGAGPQGSSQPAAPSPGAGSADQGPADEKPTDAKSGDGNGSAPGADAMAGPGSGLPLGSTGIATAPDNSAKTATSGGTTGATDASGASPTGNLLVDLSNCAGCTVIATHRGVAGEMSAALATTARGAVLLAVRPDGAVAGVINVPYGASFPTPNAGALPCDRSGRCIVTARTAGGDAILSAFHLDPDGTWRDISGGNGFPSATARGAAVDVDGDGLLEIAVQESGGGLTGWMVLTWSTDRFVVTGCAPDSATPPQASALSADSCLS